MLVPEPVQQWANDDLADVSLVHGIKVRLQGFPPFLTPQAGMSLSERMKRRSTCCKVAQLGLSSPPTDSARADMDFPLASAFIKLNRGQALVDQLETEATKFFRSHRRLILTYDEQRKRRGLFVEAERDIPIQFSLLAGDAVHNLRTALDHAVWAIMEPLKPAKPKAIHFLFAPSAANLEAEIRKRQLGTAKPELLDVIRASRPFPGPENALHALHELDIEDKHRGLLLHVSLLRFVNFSLQHFDPRCPRFENVEFLGADNQFI